MSDEEARLVCREAIWMNRMEVVESITLHEADCFARRANEAGLHLVGWDPRNFMTAVLLDRPELLGLEA